MTDKGFCKLLNQMDRELDSKPVWLPSSFVQEKVERKGKTSFRTLGIENIVAGEMSVTMARNHVTKNVISYRNGRRVNFTETVHLGESNFPKNQERAREGVYVDECRRGEPSIMNVHYDFKKDRRSVIPVEELPSTVISYGRMVKPKPDKWDKILHEAVKAAKDKINSSAPRQGSIANESIVQVGASNSGIAAEQGENSTSSL